MDKTNKTNNLGYKIGQIMAGIFFTCISACLSACVIALTLRFISWIF